MCCIEATIQRRSPVRAWVGCSPAQKSGKKRKKN
ncbi:hypothetical protein M6B38_297485 [Iris pallida]|uniref:Uncharacterized protein n=1 Tax=Iris pallida TaxID=29817 RepID=A0AAX6HR76_IRIPA|nr:hypothetical protein M6B38_297485 [Iris pallida]